MRPRAAAWSARDVRPRSDGVGLPGRGERTGGQSYAPSDQHSLARLRAQDGGPRRATGVAGLLLGGRLDPHRAGEALELFRLACTEVERTCSPEASQRLYWLALALSSHLVVEKLGQQALAVDALVTRMRRGGPGRRRAMETFARLHPSLRLCERTLPIATERLRRPRARASRSTTCPRWGVHLLVHRDGEPPHPASAILLLLSGAGSRFGSDYDEVVAREGAPTTPAMSPGSEALKRRRDSCRARGRRRRGGRSEALRGGGR